MAILLKISVSQPSGWHQLGLSGKSFNTPNSSKIRRYFVHSIELKLKEGDQK
jgi:hypothetical protein